MQPTNRSSFIPKKSIKRVERVRSKKQIYILSYVAYAIFFATLVAIAAVFFYANSLTTQLQAVINELDAQQVAFSQGNIAAVKEAERRVKIANYLFSKHAGTYAIFGEIERLAVDGVTFRSFSYERIDDALAMIEISGGTDQFDSVAFQNLLFADNNLLRGIMFDGVSKSGGGVLQEGGISDNNDETSQPVSFSVTKELPVSAIPFALNLYEVPAVEEVVPEVPADAALGAVEESVDVVANESEF
jgi:hypothetical protein